jgi:hypothetical protein
MKRISRIGIMNRPFVVPAKAQSMQLRNSRSATGARRLRRCNVPTTYRDRTPNSDPPRCGMNAALLRPTALTLTLRPIVNCMVPALAGTNRSRWISGPLHHQLGRVRTGQSRERALSQQLCTAVRNPSFSRRFLNHGSHGFHGWGSNESALSVISVPSVVILTLAAARPR